MSVEIVKAWNAMRDEGYFTTSALESALEEVGIRGQVIRGTQIKGGSKSLLGIQADDGRIYLVPAFNVTALGIQTWFEVSGSVTRKSLVRQLLEPAMLEPNGRTRKLIRGRVE